MLYQLQTLHFDASEKLVAYIDKKLAKLEKYEDIQNVTLTLKVVKPEAALNKEAKLHVNLKGKTLHADKIADSFEEAIDLCVDIIRRELGQK